MNLGFIYIWRDKLRNMYYIGSHLGDHTDTTYLSSSRWLNGEIEYRKADFRRRVLAHSIPESQLRKLEYALIAKIAEHEYGTRYYNRRSGRKKGCTAWNKGTSLSKQHRQNLSIAFTDRPAWNKGKATPHAVENARKSVGKLRRTIANRRMIYYGEDRKWAYPDGDRWFVKNESGERTYVPSPQWVNLVTR